MSEPDIPTLDDLRVKSCFICLEEEEHAPASTKANVWVHPCPNCPLLAHDKCLLRWISTLPLKRRFKRKDPNQTIFALDTFKCPRCSRQYELANPKPPPLHRVLMVGDTVFVILSALVDIACTTAGLLALQTIPVALSLQSRVTVLTGMFVYEVAFLESYLGPQMFGLLLTDRAEHLLRSLAILVPTIPFRLLLPGALPKWIIPLYLVIPPLFGLAGLSSSSPSEVLPNDSPITSRPIISSWPPSPALLGLVIVPLMIRPAYNRLFSLFRARVLGSSPPSRQKRYLSDRARGLFTFGARARAAPDAPPPPAIDALQDQDPFAEPAPVLIADQIVQKDQTSFTHDVLHAVASVVAPRVFGKLLCAAAEYSVCLRRFLGLRPFGKVRAYPAYCPGWVGLTLRQRALAACRTAGGLLLGGSWVWGHVDPVWWRNSIGYGIFVLATDCFELYRLWLQKQEVQSRTIKSRDFTGVDVAELDLIEPERFA
ncbi:hypothetical protein C8R43DRAFT_78852 [Mycena crocata]|nr:hypothetical protein C8R43DRAFT_78852 [Mycena crocata]